MRPTDVGVEIDRPAGDVFDFVMAGADGGAFALGTATFAGTLVGQFSAASHQGLPHLNAPIVDIEVTANGKGYHLAAADGGAFAFGDAPFNGTLVGQFSAANHEGLIHLRAPIVSLARTPSGKGYWMGGADGGVFALGDARFFGSLVSLGVTPGAPIVDLDGTAAGDGYWVFGADGAIYAIGGATFTDSLTTLGIVPGKPIVGGAGVG